jgi:mRNA interferase RelE/StbE
MKERIRNAIENRLAVSPERYGVPLRKTLKGYWKLRVGDYRIVFRMTSDQVTILVIVRRKTVYQEAGKRTGSP